MSKPSNKPRQPLLTLLVLGAAALAIYVPLLDRWQHSVAPTVSIPPATGLPATGLELSKELSRPGRGIAARLPDDDAERGWLVPILAFIAPLAAGFLWGRWTARSEEEHEVGRMTAVATSLSGRHYATPARSGAAARALAERQEKTDTAVEDLRAEATARGSGRTPTGPSNGGTPPTADEAELEELLQSKDELIEALEAIVKENRDEWEEREREADESRRRIGKLEAELAAAQQMIGDEEPIAARERTYAPADDIALEPQVMTRN